MERLRAPGERNGTYAAHLGCEIISSQHEQLGEILYGNEDEGDEDASRRHHLDKQGEGAPASCTGAWKYLNMVSEFPLKHDGFVGAC